MKNTINILEKKSKKTRTFVTKMALSVVGTDMIVSKYNLYINILFGKQFSIHEILYLVHIRPI